MSALMFFRKWNLSQRRKKRTFSKYLVKIKILWNQKIYTGTLQKNKTNWYPVLSNLYVKKRTIIFSQAYNLSVGLIHIHMDTQWIYLTHKPYIWCLSTERSRKHIEVEGFYCVPKKVNKIVTVIMSTDYFNVDEWVILGPACNEIVTMGTALPFDK